MYLQDSAELRLLECQVLSLNFQVVPISQGMLKNAFTVICHV